MNRRNMLLILQTSCLACFMLKLITYYTDQLPEMMPYGNVMYHSAIDLAFGIL